jgi:hypothetical protein
MKKRSVLLTILGGLLVATLGVIFVNSGVSAAPNAGHWDAVPTYPPPEPPKGDPGLPPAPPFVDTGWRLNAPEVHESLNIQYSILPMGFDSWFQFWNDTMAVAENVIEAYMPIFIVVAEFLLGLIITTLVLDAAIHFITGSTPQHRYPDSGGGRSSSVLQFIKYISKPEGGGASEVAMGATAAEASEAAEAAEVVALL